MVSQVTVEGTADASDFDENDGYTFARIKVPQGKELLVGVNYEPLIHDHNAPYGTASMFSPNEATFSPE